MHGSAPLVERCLAAGASLGDDLGRGNTVLHYAHLALDGPDWMRWLIERGAPSETPNQDGDRPLHAACDPGVVFLSGRQDKTACVEVLLEAGCDPFARNHRGEMPDHPLCQVRRQQAHLEAHLAQVPGPREVHASVGAGEAVDVGVSRRRRL